jgi:hypothetical protein
MSSSGAVTSSEEVRRRLEVLRATLDPVRLLQQIRAAQQEPVGLADGPLIGDVAPPTAPTLEQFLSGLRTAWQEGEVRPTRAPRPTAKRLRRRPLQAASGGKPMLNADRAVAADPLPYLSSRRGN